MQVYVELAVLENFCMDFTLLYSAKLASKNRAHFMRIALGAALGACFAVTFPLFKIGTVWQVVLKIISGLIICLAAGRFKGVKSYVKFTGFFLAFTALLGGALVGVFSLTGLEYDSGGGYFLSSVPIGIPLFGALVIIICARKLAQRLSKGAKNAVVCRIYAGENQAEIKGFFDSGNKVYHMGRPVSVIPQSAAKKLIGETRIKESVKIHTVAGSKTMPVFTADRIEIISDGKTQVITKILLGVSPNQINRAVLHCDLTEEINV